jgi:hypothetical protein
MHKQSSQIFTYFSSLSALSLALLNQVLMPFSTSFRFVSVLQSIALSVNKNKNYMTHALFVIQKMKLYTKHRNC